MDSLPSYLYIPVAIDKRKYTRKNREKDAGEVWTTKKKAPREMEMRGKWDPHWRIICSDASCNVGFIIIFFFHRAFCWIKKKVSSCNTHIFFFQSNDIDMGMIHAIFFSPIQRWRFIPEKLLIIGWLRQRGEHFSTEDYTYSWPPVLPDLRHPGICWFMVTSGGWKHVYTLTFGFHV